MDQLPKIHNALQLASTFFLSCFAWIFFRANTTKDAFLITKQIFHFSGNLYFGDLQQLIYCFVGIIFLLLIEKNWEQDHHRILPFQANNWIKNQFAYGILIFLILLIGVFDGGQFIYFQF